MTGNFAQELWQRQSVRQFVKFCIIGATSATIDIGIFAWLDHHGWDPLMARIVSVFVAVCNGFLWNSAWTFRGMGAGKRHEQFIKFVAVNLVGLGLNLIIMQAVFFLLTGHTLHANDPLKLQKYSALAIAIVIVSAWNFFANKKWTFSSPPVADSSR